MFRLASDVGGLGIRVSSRTSLVLTGYFQVDMLGARHEYVNFAAGKGPGVLVRVLDHDHVPARI